MIDYPVAHRMATDERIRTKEQLESLFSLSDAEREFFEHRRENTRLPLLVTRHFADLATDSPDDPIRRQFIPTIQELYVREYESEDPLSEAQFTPVPRLVHRYPNRALLLATDSCAMHCRHCFRRAFAGSGRGAITSTELGRVSSYLSEHTEIRELLLSGGDPLTLGLDSLRELLRTLRAARADIVFRVASRVPVAAPSRVDDTLLSLLRSQRPVWLVVQVNHPRELSAAVSGSISAVVAAGVPVVTQTVLLRGVNDSVSVLTELFSALVALSVKPYYLFQGDLAPGTSHFRVSLRRGLRIVGELRKHVSGLAMPVYAVDLPRAGGKVPLSESAIKGEENGFLTFESLEGTFHTYPLEHEESAL